MTKRQIEKATWLWRDYLGLKNWDIAIYWKENKTKAENNEFKTIAKAVSHPQYKLGSVYYSPKSVREIDASVVVHELLHVLMSPLVAAAYDHDDTKIEYFNEQVTSELERVITRLRNKVKD